MVLAKRKTNWTFFGTSTPAFVFVSIMPREHLGTTAYGICDKFGAYFGKKKCWRGNKDHASFFFCLAVLCITELSQHAHPLICGFTHNHATFPTRLTNGFHTELPGSQYSKSPSQKPLHTQGHSRIVGNHFSTKDNLCFQTETSKRLFKTVLRCVKKEKKTQNIFSSVVCFAAALWTSTAVYNQTECFTGHSQG